MTKSPTLRLLLGLLITLAAVTGFSSYTLYQLHGLRRLQTGIIDLNRHDSLQLLELQDAINKIGLNLRDMLAEPEDSGISRYRARLDGLRNDLNSSVNREARILPYRNGTGKHAQLLAAGREFWRISDSVFAAASAGHEAQARDLLSEQLFPQQEKLAALVSALLERNNAAEEAADQKVSWIYDGVERDIYVFMAATMLAILVTSLYLIYSNRRIFRQLQSYSRQHRVLAARLITVQEEVLRSVSRELHDEFGQILTAVSAMLARAEKKGVPPGSPLRTELSEVREITHSTLEKIRSVSQMLHPAVIDDYGLAKAVEWYTDLFTRQTGLETSAKIVGDPVRITGQKAIHCFRIVQEALTNAAKHSGSPRAEVALEFAESALTITIQDFGSGISQNRLNGRNGLGVIAMRERAELVNGVLDIRSSAVKGTSVSVSLPLKTDEIALEDLNQQSRVEELASHE